MQQISKLDKLTSLILNKTVKDNIPTVVFLSNIKETDLIKNLLSKKIKKEYNESDFTSQDWIELADIMLRLINIPLIIKTIHSTKETRKQIDEFTDELRRGIVIIDCSSYNFPITKPSNNIIKI